jgi:hypothetical protein
MACLAEGGVVVQVSSVYFHCAGGGIFADFGGPTGNVVAGLTCIALLRRCEWGAAERACLVLGAAFNFLWLAGCLLWSSIAGQSDFAFAIRLLGHDQISARIVLGMVGVAIGLTMRHFVAGHGLSRSAARVAYFVAGIVSCTAALAYAGAVGPALREAALESFGAMAWLLAVPRTASAASGNGNGEGGGKVLWPLAALSMLGLLALGRGYEQVPNSSVEQMIGGEPLPVAHVER